jgi:hypothetical protein
MAKVWCVQMCNERGENRMLDKVCVEKEKAINWIKEIYPNKKWFFSDYANYKDSDKTNEIVPESSFFFVHGIDKRGRISHWIIEGRNLY